MFSEPFAVITQDAVTIHFLSFATALLRATAQARRRVWVFAYVVNANLNKAQDPVTHFLALLREKKARGCDIRFIIDDPAPAKNNYHCNKFFMRRLMEWGFEFCTPPVHVTSHAKCILVDETVLFIGSHNLTRSSLQNPLDCTVELRNDFLIKSFAETYQMIWRSETMKSYKPGDVKFYPYYG